MSYLVLARKWRPQLFGDVTGQDHISRTLANALKTGRAAHAYLFCGPRGVGKTSMARILAKALNCEQSSGDEPCNRCDACAEITSGRSLDVIEIDGASNRGIDDIRDLREGVRYAPARLRTKVYIIDEVHMLTTDAFNALLKTLEEPPPHVVFVLATTEPLKLPPTITSRCQRYEFARLRPSDAAARLAEICRAEGIAADEEALGLLARKGEGSMRDALTLLDQVIAAGRQPIDLALVRETLGLAGRELYFTWSEAILTRDASRALASLAQAIGQGANLQELADEFLAHLRNLLVLATDASLVALVEATHEEQEQYGKQAREMAVADLLRYCRLGMEASQQMRRSSYPRLHLEVALAEMCRLPQSVELRRFVEAARGQASLPSAPSAPREAALGGSLPAGGASRGAPSRTLPSREFAAPSAEAAPLVKPADLAAKLRAALKGPAAGPTAEAAPTAAAPPEPATAAPVPNAVSTPTPTPGSDGDASWAKFLAELGTSKPALASVLARAEARLEGDALLRVLVPGLATYQREQLDRREHKKLISDLAARIYGQPVAVQFEAGGAASGKPGAGTGRGPAAPSAGPGDPNAASPERVRRIADLFDGDVIGPA